MMKSITLMIMICALSNVFADESNKAKPEMDVSMALLHYEAHKDVRPLEDWPKEYFEGFPQMLTLKKAVNSKEDVTLMLNERPQKFKDRDIVYQILERNGFYIVALLPNGQTEPTQLDQSVLAQAYVIPKGTKRLFCWMNW
jgi:hypothetical protein